MACALLAAIEFGQLICVGVAAFLFLLIAVIVGIPLYESYQQKAEERERERAIKDQMQRDEKAEQHAKDWMQHLLNDNQFDEAEKFVEDFRRNNPTSVGHVYLKNMIKGRLEKNQTDLDAIWAPRFGLSFDPETAAYASEWIERQREWFDFGGKRDWRVKRVIDYFGRAHLTIARSQGKAFSDEAVVSALALKDLGHEPPWAVEVLSQVENPVRPPHVFRYVSVLLSYSYPVLRQKETYRYAHRAYELLMQGYKEDRCIQEYENAIDGLASLDLNVVRVGLLWVITHQSALALRAIAGHSVLILERRLLAYPEDLAKYDALFRSIEILGQCGLRQEADGLYARTKHAVIASGKPIVQSEMALWINRLDDPTTRYS